MKHLSSRTTYMILTCVGVAVFIPLYGAGFVTDFLGWIDCQQDTPLWQSHTCFNNRGLYYVPFILLTLLTSLFEFHPLAWFLTFTGIHIFNGCLLVMLARKLFTLFDQQAPEWVFLFTGLLFILWPYQVEVVAWKACINYLTSCTLFLLVMIHYIKWLMNEERRWPWAVMIMYGLSLLNLEFALVVPALLAGLHLLMPGSANLRLAMRGITPLLVLIAIFFIVNTYLIGKAVGHYHVELASLNPLHLASAELKYTFKLLFFGRLWPYPIQDTIYGTLSAPLAGGLALAALLGFAAWVLIRRKSLNNKLLFNTFLLFGAVLFILPIAHLYFYYLQYSENDRYTYFSLVFVCMLLPSLLWRYRFGRFALGLYLAISVAATLHFNRLWQQSDQVHDHLAETFRWHDRSEVYLLNVPDNLRGMFMFRNIGGDSAFEEVLTLLKGDSVQAKIYDIYQYNMATPQDGVSAVQVNDSTYQATFNQWGNWWWRNGIGGTPYETEKYVTQIDGQSFSVTFKHMADDAAVIYFDGSDWQELD